MLVRWCSSQHCNIGGLSCNIGCSFQDGQTEITRSIVGWAGLKGCCSAVTAHLFQLARPFSLLLITRLFFSTFHDSAAAVERNYTHSWLSHVPMTRSISLVSSYSSLFLFSFSYSDRQKSDYHHLSLSCLDIPVYLPAWSHNHTVFCLSDWNIFFYPKIFNFNRVFFFLAHRLVIGNPTV